ncbi:MAG: maleylpyruvate isomerase N-terminal domain-containing protein [Anaerolineaceae bacterium]|nr:maleylpyruvate isomerase N-terminal domain-containing protein [Anaerolineaceae bacterium]
MNKTELIVWLRGEQQQWLDLLNQFDDAELEMPGVNGDWSLKDLVAHLTTWHRDHIICLGAAVKNTPIADPPWPLEISNTDDINAWIFSQSSRRKLKGVLDENEQVFEALIEIVENFPEGIQIEIIKDHRVVRFGEQQFSVGYFFDHFHEDHEAQIREWLKKRK